jgi:DNA modification methylase
VTIDLRQGDCLDVLRTIDTNTIDAIVTDPPYGLSFMGKRWDYDVPSVEVWYECLRVLKPGGHLLAFAGTRTQHRMACRIEDAGFEIRDMIAWVYGSGFPKSLDVSKAIDKRKDWSLVDRLAGEIRRARTEAGLSLAEIGEATMAATAGTYGKWYHRGGHMFFETGRSLPSRPEWDRLRHVLPIAPEFTAVYDEAEREVVGVAEMRDTSEVRIAVTASADDYDAAARREVAITAPATDDAKRWAGWGTALKPALEPITVARKPLAGTVAATVLEHGTGAINVDGCRVGTEATITVRNGNSGAHGRYGKDNRVFSRKNPPGRWPANLIHDGSEEPAELLGTAARFFYCAKASRSDRGDGNGHPTVKPTELMRYLCRLVTPPGGTVLDPFMGSGSTGKAAALEGFHFLGIEREAQYLDIARARIRAVVDAAPLFAGKP